MSIMYVIQHNVRCDLHWCHNEGWLGLEKATVYNVSEQQSARLPIEGHWVRLPEWKHIKRDDYYAVSLVDIATGAETFVWQSSECFPTGADKNRIEAMIEPGRYLQNWCDGHRTTKKYHLTDCPHTSGYIYRHRICNVWESDGSWSLSGLPTLDEFYTNCDEETDTIEDVSLEFQCMSCHSTFSLEISEETGNDQFVLAPTQEEHDQLEAEHLDQTHADQDGE